MNRSELPFRKNVEGYFFNKDGQILVKKTSFGVVFPGGGVDARETTKDAIFRETFEETGCLVSNILEICNLKFIWSDTWAHTAKQKKRFKEFQGEDMFFFTGKIYEIKTPEEKSEDYWGEDIFLNTDEVLGILKDKFEKDKQDYTKKQLALIKKLSRLK